MLINLANGDLDFDQETSYAELRIQLGKENEEKINDEEKISPEEAKKIEEVSARSRQTFDPVEKVFDNRKRRVTKRFNEKFVERKEIWLESRKK